MSDKIGIFIGGPLYSGGSAVIDDLKASGFNEVVGWAGMDSTGDITYQGTTLVSGGAWVDTPSNTAFQTQLESLTSGDSIELQLMLGGWQSWDWNYIKDLIFPQPGDYPNNPQIGDDTLIYQNFNVLKNALPVVGINLDIEPADASNAAKGMITYDTPTTLAFSRLLNNLGYAVTFNPYQNNSWWTGILYDLNTATPGLVSRFYLQCYAGGRQNGNTPSGWIEDIQEAMGPDFDAVAMVFPGLWCCHGGNNELSSCDSRCPVGDTDPASYCNPECPNVDGTVCSGVQEQFGAWKSSGISGGWIWIYDDIQQWQDRTSTCPSSPAMDAAAYAAAISSGLS